jgi:mRNA interferase RelE/StbE
MSDGYAVYIRRSAEKKIARLPPKIRRQVSGRVLELETNPRRHDVKRLRSRERTFRIASGEYRIVYEIDDDSKSVTVLTIQHRKDVYRNL